MSFEKWREMKAAIADAQVQQPGEDFEAFMFSDEDGFEANWTPLPCRM